MSSEGKTALLVMTIMIGCILWMVALGAMFGS